MTSQTAPSSGRNPRKPGAADRAEADNRSARLRALRVAESAPSPRPVTRGESPQEGGQVVKVDWLNATFPEPKISISGFVQLLGRMLGRPVYSVDGRGLIGFEKSVILHARHGSVTSPIGAIAWGGTQQNGRWLLQLTGTGCQLVRDWEPFRDLLDDLGAKITRVDLALDFLSGEYTVDDAVHLYEEGGFQLGGRPPKSAVAGDWLGGKAGRTLYVGDSKNGKMLRVYEKGKQLGDEASAWTRFEVQIGSRDRLIPYDVLTRRDAFFAGCYSALESMVMRAAERIKTERKSGEVSVSHLLYHLKRCYGKLLHICEHEIGVTNADLVQELRVFGLPRRVNVSSLAAGISWADVQAQMQLRKVA